MKALDRKLLRDAWRMRGHLGAVALVTMCGIATYVTMTGSYEALRDARDRYYRDHRFGDVFANVKRAPRSLLGRIEALPGVALAEDRLSTQVTLQLEGFAEPASALLVSVPDHARPRLNDVHIAAGRYLEPGATDEVLLGQGFAAAHRLQPGMSIAAVINGRWQRLHIAGIATSPEFVFLPSGAAIFPDNQRYGVLWMNRAALEDRLDMKSAFNALSLRLAPGASARAVIEPLDVLLKPYGAVGARARAEQFSHQMLQGELQQDRVTGTVIPTIFLGVTAFLLHNVLARLIALQRAQIGVLKSFGYARGVLAWHFVKLALLPVGLGTLAGIALGAWLGSGLVTLYQKHFHFPVLVFALTPMTVLGSCATALATALLGTLPAVRRALDLPPAEAMRPPAPPRFGRLLLERLGIVHWIGPAARMVWRNVERRPLRSFTSILAVALAGALMVVGQFGVDAIDETVRVQFRAARRDDVRLAFAEPRGSDIHATLAQLPGVLLAEPFRVVAIRMQHEHRRKEMVLFGLPPNAELHRVVDIANRTTAIPADGLLLSTSLAQVLHVTPGMSVEVEFMEGRRLVRAMPIVALVDEPIGQFAYMDSNALARWLEESPRYSDAYLRVDPRELDALYAALRRLPAVSSVALREATLRSFLATIGENLLISMSILIGFAGTIVAGVVYNGARIALSEHATTFASLRILGFRQREVTVMLLGEQAVLTLAAIPLGLALGYALSWTIAALLATELYRVPLVISTRTILWSSGAVLIAAAASGTIVALRARGLDLIAVLKTRE